LFAAAKHSAAPLITIDDGQTSRSYTKIELTRLLANMQGWHCFYCSNRVVADRGKAASATLKQRTIPSGDTDPLCRMLSNYVVSCLTCSDKRGQATESDFIAALRSVGNDPKVLASPGGRAPVECSATTIAQAADYAELMCFLLPLRDEIDDGTVDPDLLAEIVESLTNRIAGLAFIVRGPTSIEASLGLLFEKASPLSRHYRVRCIWNVVAPEARKTGHAKGLLAAATRFADQLERPFYLIMPTTPRQIEISPALEPSAKIRFCARHMAVAGTVFAHIPASSG
jgi:hypothetical protein